MRALEDLDKVGVGICYQRDLTGFYEGNRDAIDYIEVPAIPGRADQVMADGFDVIVHSIHLSPLSASPIEPTVFDAVLDYIQKFTTPWWSEHLAFFKVPGHDTQFVLPLIKTPESLDLACDKISHLMDRVELPFIVENTPDHFEIPIGTMSDGEFISEVCEQTGAGLLLDLNHAHITAENSGTNPFRYLEQMPLSKVIEVHVAGSKLEDGILWDAHEAPLKPDVYELLDFVLGETDVKAVTLECTSALGAATIREELDRLRAQFH